MDFCPREVISWGIKLQFSITVHLNQINNNTLNKVEITTLSNEDMISAYKIIIIESVEVASVLLRMVRNQCCEIIRGEDYKPSTPYLHNPFLLDEHR